MTLKHSFLLTIFILPYLLLSQDASNPQDISGKSDALIELTEQNFDQSIFSGTDGKWFVMFYVPWCPHCKAATPAFNDLANYLEGQVNIARVDCDANPELQSRYAIRGYPTLLLFYKGEVYQHHGIRTVEAWTDFINRGYMNAQTQTSKANNGIGEEMTPNPDGPNLALDDNGSLVDLNKDNFNDKVFENIDNRWMVMFYAPWCGYSKKAMPAFREFANVVKDHVNVGRVDCEANPGFKSRLNVKSFPTILFFSNGEIRKFEGVKTVETLTDFANGGYKKTKIIEENVHRISYVEGTDGELRLFGVSIFTIIIGVSIIASMLLLGILVVLYRNQKAITSGHTQLHETSVEDNSRNEIEFSPVRTSP